MKTLAKLTLTATAIIAVSTHLSLANTNDYRLIALENCNVVAEHALNTAQVDAYLQLKSSEQAMERATAPMDNIEEDIDRYTTQISELTRRAVQESGDTLTINHTLLAEQQVLTGELEALIDHHRGDFDAIEKQAAVIETSARRFEDAIDPLLNDMHYDMVRIVGPKYHDAPFPCSDNSALIIM